jgi:hypothetical protein
LICSGLNIDVTCGAFLTAKFATKINLLKYYATKIYAIHDAIGSNAHQQHEYGQWSSPHLYDG